MATVIRSPEARNDLIEISVRIARDNPAASAKWLRRIEATLDLLVKHPEIGEARPELAATLRSFSVGNYVILYRGAQDGIDVVRVLHASRDIEAMF